MNLNGNDSSPKSTDSVGSNDRATVPTSSINEKNIPNVVLIKKQNLNTIKSTLSNQEPRSNTFTTVCTTKKPTTISK